MNNWIKMAENFADSDDGHILLKSGKGGHYNMLRG